MILLRSAARGAALALLLLAFVPIFSIARDLRINIDPNSEAFTMGGWDRRVADTGTIFYTCNEDSCGRGSIVSMRKQTNAPNDIETLRRSERGVSDQMMQRAQGRIARIDIDEPSLVNDGTFRIGEVTRTIVPAGGGSIPGLSNFWKTGFVASPRLIYSIGSSADSRQLANENYDLFKFGLMMMAVRK